MPPACSPTAASSRFPTETVYGLGAHAERPDAVRRIFAIKGRPAGHPLIVHGADAGVLDRYAEPDPDGCARTRATRSGRVR